MFGLVIAIHVIVCVLLIIIILIQAGRGGGLVESLSSVESMFGTKTNALLARTTAILSTIFFITCVGLAFLSLQQSRSLMRHANPAAAAGQTLPGGETKKEVTPQTKATPDATAPKPSEEVPKTE